MGLIRMPLLGPFTFAMLAKVAFTFGISAFVLLLLLRRLLLLLLLATKVKLRRLATKVVL